MNIKLTDEYKKRISNEIIDSELKLGKEMAYSSDLQKTDRIKELKRHIMKLNKILADGFIVTEVN